MIKYIFLDFNGTIINDVDLCLDLLNKMLRHQGKKELSLEEYKNVFTFPIIKYYEKAGIDFSMNSYEELAIWFIKEYQPKSMMCGLYEGLIEALETLKNKGYHLVILSASEKNNLYEQCQAYDIVKYFDDILGIDNIHAASKVEIALKYLESKNINGEEVLFIGDTLHDLEVAKCLKADCKLVSCGHQSVEVLATGGVEILDSVKELAYFL